MRAEIFAWIAGLLRCGSSVVLLTLSPAPTMSSLQIGGSHMHKLARCHRWLQCRRVAAASTGLHQHRHPSAVAHRTGRCQPCATAHGPCLLLTPFTAGTGADAGSLQLPSKHRTCTSRHPDVRAAGAPTSGCDIFTWREQHKKSCAQSVDALA
jgi:hypothetical protein